MRSWPVTARVEIYTRDFCGYCTRAKALLASKGVAFDEIRAGDDADKRREMIQRSQGATYPQIFINGRHVGGSDDIHDLDRAGRLDALLAESAAA
jgi:glutaredoxin 3